MSIFNRLTSENENSVTELLVNVINENKLLRDLVIKFFCDDINELQLDSIRNNIKTQTRHNEYGQQDFIIESSEVFIIFENKIRRETTLTSHEINDYKKYVGQKKKAYKKYVFCVPRQYKYKDIIAQIQKENESMIVVKYWEDLIDFMNKKQIGEMNSVYKEVLNYFGSIIDLDYQREFDNYDKFEVAMMYSANELIDSIGVLEKTITRMGAVEQEVIDQLNAYCSGEYSPSNWITKDCKDQSVYFPTAKMINYNGKSYLIAWGFIDLKDRNSNEKFSFSVAVSDSIANNCDEALHKNGWQYLPLNKRNLLEENNDKFVDDVVSCFKRLLPQK